MTISKPKKKNTYIFSVLQCSIRRCRARYMLRQGKKTERLYFHPYKPVSQLLSHQGFLLSRIFAPSFIYLICIKRILELLRSKVLFLRRHEDTSSLRLLSDNNSGRRKMSNFSLRQRLHLLFAQLWGDLDERIRHEIQWLMLFSLRVQIRFYKCARRDWSEQVHYISIKHAPYVIHVAYVIGTCARSSRYIL